MSFYQCATQVSLAFNSSFFHIPIYVSVLCIQSAKNTLASYALVTHRLLFTQHVDKTNHYCDRYCDRCISICNYGFNKICFRETTLFTYEQNVEVCVYKNIHIHVKFVSIKNVPLIYCRHTPNTP